MKKSLCCNKLAIMKRPPIWGPGAKYWQCSLCNKNCDVVEIEEKDINIVKVVPFDVASPLEEWTDPKNNFCRGFNDKDDNNPSINNGMG